MQADLAEGKEVYAVFQQAGYNAYIVSKLKLASLSGNIPQMLKSLSEELQDREEKLHQLKQILIYPLFLLAFLFGILLMLRHSLLPALQTFEQYEQRLSYHLLQLFPFLCLLLFCFVILGFHLWKVKLRQKEILQQLTFLSRLPFLGTYYRYYWTSYFCSEWGRLLLLGIDHQKIVYFLQQEGNLGWIQALAQQLECSFQAGQSLDQALQAYSFLSPSLPIFIAQGEAKGKLGAELIVYADDLWKHLLFIIDQYIQLIQPLVFLFVGIVIISLYVSLLLPMYQCF